MSLQIRGFPGKDRVAGGGTSSRDKEGRALPDVELWFAPCA